MTTLMTSTMNRFHHIAQSGASGLVAPLQGLLTIYIMWQHVGIGCAGGIGVVIILLALEGFYLEPLFEAVFAEENRQNDKRVTMLGEIISAIKLIKLYAWEKSFSHEVNEVRK